MLLVPVVAVTVQLPLHNYLESLASDTSVQDLKIGERRDELTQSQAGWKGIIGQAEHFTGCFG